MGNTKKKVSRRKIKEQIKKNVLRLTTANNARRNLSKKQNPSDTLINLDAVSATNIEERDQLGLETFLSNDINQQREHKEISVTRFNIGATKSNDDSKSKIRKRKFCEAVNSQPNNNKVSKHSVDEQSDLPYEVAFGVDEIMTIKDGNHRIVDFKYYTDELKRISSHESLFQCSFNTLNLVSEIKHGLVSKFLYTCALCKKDFWIMNSTENINVKAVEGAMAAGCGNALLGQITASLDLPPISDYSYGIYHNEICKAWETTAWNEMQKAGYLEREAAIKEGRVNKDGIPLIDVIADGCWSKRSYKTNYAALSGAAAIIGKRFGQVLFMSVKNKYCCICARSEKQNITPNPHECFKNYSGTSTSMESTILVEGFKQSIDMHQMIYARFIADGDSSTYAKILESRPYPGITVEKISCRNHILRNFCNKLQLLKNDTKYSLKERKQVTSEKILSARKYIVDAIKYHNNNRQLDSIQCLHADITQCFYHAFGDHSNCSKNICVRNDIVISSTALFFNSSLYSKIRYLVSNVASNARSLIENVDSNIVERFNGVIAKFVGGKRINYSLKRSYQARCAGAVISFNSGKIQSTVSRHVWEKSPAKRLKSFEEKIDKRREYHRIFKRRKNRALMPKKIDFSYGENVETPDMDAETYEMSKRTFLNGLKKTDAERRDIQSRTIMQSENGEWMELRRNLLTASNFGKIAKRLKTNSCANTVKNMLYKPDIGHVTSIKHGRSHEKEALEQLSKLLKVQIEPCGLFLDKFHPFLGATPDGIIGSHTVVEIKCPIIPYKIGIDAAIMQGKMHFWRLDKKSGEIQVNKNSDWYFQIQGQMHICEMPKCLLAVWYGDNKLKIETVTRDLQFWKEKMETKLVSFYFDCMLPELVDPRFTRNKPIREPNYSKNSKENREDNVIKKVEKNQDHGVASNILELNQF